MFFFWKKMIWLRPFNLLLISTNTCTPGSRQSGAVTSGSLLGRADCGSGLGKDQNCVDFFL